MTFSSLIICTLMITLMCTYCLLSECDPKRLVKFSLSELVMFCIFIFSVVFVTVFFTLAMVAGVQL